VGQAGLLDAAGMLKPIEGMDALTDAFRLVTERTGKAGLTMESGAEHVCDLAPVAVAAGAAEYCRWWRKGQFAYGPAGERRCRASPAGSRQGLCHAGPGLPGVDQPVHGRQCRLHDERRVGGA
jgi:multiple sugar transport system substrate-binding protein